MHGSFPCAEETCLCKFHVPPLKKRKDLGGSDVSRQNDKQINNKRSYMSPYVPTPYHVYAACIQFAYIVRKSPTTSPPTHNHHNPFRQHECLILIRPNSDGDRGRCSAYVVVRLCEDRFANWAREPWPSGTGMRRTGSRQDLRPLDESKQFICLIEG